MLYKISFAIFFSVFWYYCFFFIIARQFFLAHNQRFMNGPKKSTTSNMMEALQLSLNKQTLAPVLDVFKNKVRVMISEESFNLLTKFCSVSFLVYSNKLFYYYYYAHCRMSITYQYYRF